MNINRWIYHHCPRPDEMLHEARLYAQEHAETMLLQLCDRIGIERYQAWVDQQPDDAGPTQFAVEAERELEWLNLQDDANECNCNGVNRDSCPACRPVMTEAALDEIQF